MKHKTTKRCLQVTVAALAAGAMIAPTLDAHAARRNGRLRLVDVNVDEMTAVAQNGVVVLRFNRAVRPTSVHADSVQILARNATGTGFTLRVRGEFEVTGKFVEFRPTLPTHLRGEDQSFPAVGSAADVLASRPAFLADREHEVRVIARPRRSAVRGRKGQRLRRTITARFRTAPAGPANLAYTTTTYPDAPPPQVRFTNPADQPVSVADQYTGSSRLAVPTTVPELTLFMNRVPLSIPGVRRVDGVQLDLVEQGGEPTLPRPVAGAAYVAQDHEEVRLHFVPDFGHEPQSTYVLRLGDGVRDLTEQFSAGNAPTRLRLTQLHEFLESARAFSPGVPPEQLPDPPADLIRDWPLNSSERGVLKANLLALGDTRPHEIDPSVHLVYETE